MKKDVTKSYRTIDVGDKVRIKKVKDTATVVRVIDGMDKMVVLDKKIRGYTHYHPKELIKVS